MRFENALASSIASVLSEGGDAVLVVDPRVDRTVTADLAAASLEDVGVRLARSLGATYEFALGGVARIVPNGPDKVKDSVDWLPMISDGPNEPIAAHYQWMIERILAGQGAELRRRIGKNVNADAFVRTVRDYPKCKTIYFAYAEGKVGDVEAVVAHRNGADEERRYRDLWRRDGSDWRWVSRKPLAANDGLRFYDAKVAEVLSKFFAHHRLTFSLQRPLPGRITVYLDGYDFRGGLSKLLRAAELTYRVEDGRYLVAALIRPWGNGANPRNGGPTHQPSSSPIGSPTACKTRECRFSFVRGG